MIKILPVFGHKNKTMTNIKNLRHGSLQMNVINMHVNFGKNQCNIKREILDQKLSHCYICDTCYHLRPPTYTL